MGTHRDRAAAAIGFHYNGHLCQGVLGNHRAVFLLDQGANSGNVQCVSGDGVTEVTTNTALSPQVKRLYQIEIISGVSVKFYVDNSLVATHTTNLPASQLAGGFEIIQLKNPSGVSNYLDVDALFIEQSY
jgi:hypothetical protein